jgi:hypothetical protein
MWHYVAHIIDVTMNDEVFTCVNIIHILIEYKYNISACLTVVLWSLLLSTIPALASTVSLSRPICISRC